MRKTLRSAVLAAAMVVAAPALAHPPGEDDDGKADAATAQATAGDAATSPASDPDGAGKTAEAGPAARAGAGGMEPLEVHAAATKESREDRDEREFVTAIWNSP